MVCCGMEFVSFPALVSLFCFELLLCDGTAFRSITYTSGFVLFCFNLNYSVSKKLIISSSSELPISVLIYSVLSQPIVRVHLSVIFIFSALSNSLLSNSRSSFLAFVLFYFGLGLLYHSPDSFLPFLLLFNSE